MTRLLTDIESRAARVQDIRQRIHAGRYDEGNITHPKTLDALARDVGDEGLNQLLTEGISGTAYEAAHAACEMDGERWDGQS